MVICPWCEREIDVPEIVEIDLDAKPPKIPYRRGEHGYYRWKDCIEAMIGAGWRKVKS